MTIDEIFGSIRIYFPHFVHKINRLLLNSITIYSLTLIVFTQYSNSPKCKGIQLFVTNVVTVELR